ncbi:MAG: hypothetical protein DME09_23060, partial [Candidatus Rokuibacteriota bacterium]
GPLRPGPRGGRARRRRWRKGRRDEARNRPHPGGRPAREPGGLGGPGPAPDRARRADRGGDARVPAQRRARPRRQAGLARRRGGLPRRDPAPVGVPAGVERARPRPPHAEELRGVGRELP